MKTVTNLLGTTEYHDNKVTWRLFDYYRFYNNPVFDTKEQALNYLNESSAILKKCGIESLECGVCRVEEDIITKITVHEMEYVNE